MNNLKKILTRIKEFVSGFFLKEYIVDLPDEPICSSDELLLNLGNRMDAIIKRLSDLPIREIVIGMKPYTIRKVTNEALYNTLVQEKECISFTKVSVENFISSQRHEIDVLNTIYSLGLDNEIWEFRFNPHITYKCSNKVFETEIINILCQFSQASIHALHLDLMSKYLIKVGSTYDDKLGEKNFEGKVTTYGKYEDSMIYGINDILPNPYENDANHYTRAIHVKPVEELQKEENLVVKVVRRKSGNRVSDSFKKAMKTFDIDVISSMVTGEVSDVEEEESNVSSK